MIDGTLPTHADVVVVGSGLAGATFVAELAQQWPGASILMLEAGPLAARPAGQHFSNIDADVDREAARRAAQGPARDTAYAPATEAELDQRRAGLADNGMRRRPGLFSLSSGPLDGTAFPAAQATSVVGGMGSQWFGACPRPSAEERVPFIDERVMDQALARAEAHLKVNLDPLPPNPAAASLRAALSDRFDAGRSPDRRVGPMPMALRWDHGRVLRTGVADILGALLDAPHERFNLATGILARRLLTHGDRVTAVECVGPNGAAHRVAADHVFVAADSLRTPQLLFASGIRPRALGRHLNEHPLIIVDPRDSGEGGIIADSGVLSVVSAIEYVPYIGEAFPYEIEVTMLGGRGAASPLLNIHTYTHSDISFSNRVAFSDTESDWLGMPAMSFHFELSDDDRRRLGEGVVLIRGLLQQLGIRSAAIPRIAPSGSSLHYQGTVRMGAHDDGTSVCDRHGRVWGLSNLFVGGNGVIPTRTAANPSLSAASLAVLSADEIAAST